MFPGIDFDPVAKGKTWPNPQLNEKTYFRVSLVINLQIELTRGYGVNEFHDDLKRLLIQVFADFLCFCCSSLLIPKVRRVK